MMKLAVACLELSGLISMAWARTPRPYAVEHYNVQIRTDFAGKHISGTVQLKFHSRVDSPLSALELDAGGLEIKKVTEGTAPQYFERNGELLVVVLTTPVGANEHRTLTVEYQAGPGRGLQFSADQVYTSNDPSDWMVCDDRADNPATLHLEIAAPEGMKVEAGGKAGPVRPSEGYRTWEWELDSPTPAGLFGFAAGKFAESASETDSVKLRVLGTAAPAGEPTAAVLRYLGERTGKKYAGASYTEVYVHGDGAQALVGGAILPEAYAQNLVKQPEDQRLLADELAHQWYGVAIRPKDGSDGWLSEGLSAFLADAFLEQRFGKERYEREVESARQAYQAWRREGTDRALSSPDWTAAQAGQIVAQKAVCFLYLLRTMLGDGPFWNGLRAYTAEQWGRQAGSEDFQALMASGEAVERKSTAKNGKNAKGAKRGGKSVEALFDEWVYGVAPSGKK